MNTNLTTGGVIIFSGPHGAGKDTLETRFRDEYPHTARIVRHITRDPAPNEIPDVDYHFVTGTEFDEIAAQNGFIEHAAYIGCQSGTSKAEVYAKVENGRAASITANFEDGLKLREKLTALGLVSVCLFISPCSYETMLHNPEMYTALLRERMEVRARSSDLIEGRIRKALFYRELYFSRGAEAIYIDNSNGALDQASKLIARLAIIRAFTQE